MRTIVAAVALLGVWPRAAAEGAPLVAQTKRLQTSSAASGQVPTRRWETATVVVHRYQYQRMA